MLPNSDTLNFDAPMQPISLNASQPGASPGFLFRTFWMGPTQRTSGDYSLRCNTLLRLERW
jgi:hypothetical protein